MLYANFDHAGTDKFVTHEIPVNETKTLCGLMEDKMKGNWEYLDDEIISPSCKKCSAIKRSAEQAIGADSGGRESASEEDTKRLDGCG